MANDESTAATSVKHSYEQLATGELEGSEETGLSFERRKIDYILNITLSSDGTSIIAHGNDQALHTFVLPPDLLEKDKRPHTLKAYATSAHSNNVHSYAVYPQYRLDDTCTSWVLSSCRDVPIQLRNALGYDYRGATYPWIHATTEKYLSANSLIFLRDGTRFAAGSRGRIAIFDVNQDGGAPIVSHITSSRNVDVGSIHDTGLVMALAESKSRLLASGSTNRNVILYPESGLGKAEAAFNLATLDDLCTGGGITGLAWSSCEKYLLVAERQSDVVQVFDIRTTGQRLSWLSGRNAHTAQRLEMEMISTDAGSEVWAGGTDGYVRMWSNIGDVEGEQKPSHAVCIGESPVGAVRWHPRANILATCCGGRTMNDAFLDIDSSDDGGSEDFQSTELARETRIQQQDSLSLWLPR